MYVCVVKKDFLRQRIFLVSRTSGMHSEGIVCSKRMSFHLLLRYVDRNDSTREQLAKK